MADNLICFVHINKNGGSSVRELLRRNYAASSLLELMIQGRRSVDGRAKSVDSFDEDVLQAVSEAQSKQQRLCCCAANLPFGIHSYLDRPVSYFTFLREPVGRCISYWNFAFRTRHEGRLWSKLEACEFDLERIRQTHTAYQFFNDQIRMITGSSNPEPGVTELALAREIIERDFALVGATERLSDGIRFLARQFGWTDASCGRVNAGDNGAFLPAGADRYFRETNEWDIRLYEWLVREYLPRKLD
jgi:hypothetical protein